MRLRLFRTKSRKNRPKKNKTDKECRKTSKLRRNLKLYYIFRVFCTMNFVMPIFILFLMDIGLSSFEVMVTQAIYMFTELLLTVPSGAFADKVGRKKTLLLSTLLYAMAFAVYGFAQNVTHVIFIEILFAAASASFHGTGEAFLYDTLAEAKEQKRYKKVIGNAYAIQSVVMGASAVAGGWMASHDLALPFFLSALPIAFSSIPLFFLDEPKRKQNKDEYWPLMKKAALFTARHVKLRNLMYFTGITTLTGFIGWMFLQPLLRGMGLKLEYLGVAMMFLAVSHGIGNKLAHRFEQRMKKLDLLLAFAGFKALLYMLIAVASGYYLIVWAVLNDLAYGLVVPLVTERINRHSNEENRATVLSLSSMAGCLSFALLSPLLGVYVDAYSEQHAYMLLALMLLAYAARQLLMALLARKQKKRLPAAG
jgi:MFS family permease